MPAAILALGKLIIGEVVSSAVEGKKEPLKEVVSKGLIRSKTANVAHAGMVAKLTAAWMLPFPTHLLWILTGVIIAEWAGNLWLRIKTKGPV